VPGWICRDDVVIVQRLLNQLIAQDVRDFRVLAAIAKVPRQLFVDEAMAHKAWDNTALPIGHGQTISQDCASSICTMCRPSTAMGG